MPRWDIGEEREGGDRTEALFKLSPKADSDGSVLTVPAGSLGGRGGGSCCCVVSTVHRSVPAGGLGGGGDPVVLTVG